MLPEDRILSLYEQVKYLDQSGIAGAFVECGVWKGGAVGMMALAAGGPAGERKLHLFDSFTDICEPHAELDGDRALQEVGSTGTGTGALRPIEGAYDGVGGHGTVEACKKLLHARIGYSKDLVDFHIGWFQDTLPVDAGSIGPIALLRLDGDWYESTRVCLEHLYDLVVPGGFVVIDDYGTYEGCKKAVNEFVASRKIPVFLQSIDIGCVYFTKPGEQTGS